MKWTLLFRNNKVPLLGKLSAGMPWAIRPLGAGGEVAVIIRPVPVIAQ